MMEGLRLAGLGFRMWKYLKRERSAGRVPIMDPFNSPSPGTITYTYQRQKAVVDQMSSDLDCR